MTIDFVDPQTFDPLIQKGNKFYNSKTQKEVASIINDIPRFVQNEDNYAESFGWQWKKWKDTLSDSRNNTGQAKYKLLLERTHFDEYNTAGKTILECGMGGGDDTEVLLSLDFSEVHSFDISTSVDRAGRCLQDDRLVLSQASIYEIPYPDNSFDFVFCHRVLQHTPNPKKALHSICKKVKKGGLLFAHSYKKSPVYMMKYKYKYRWLTKKIPVEYIYNFLEDNGSWLYSLNEYLTRSNIIFKGLAYSFIPFENGPAEYGNLNREQLIELAKLITFDALTPTYDYPMKDKDFIRIIESEGFKLEHFFNPKVSPMYCTAVKL
jgi:ubiquinone/menaquinone biosynthesis C-methylase UbiE